MINTQNPNYDGLTGLRQAAEEIGVSYFTLYGWIEKRWVASPDVVVGKRRFYSAGQLARLRTGVETRRAV